MKKMLICGSLLMGALVLLPAGIAHAQKKDKKDKKNSVATPQEYAQIRNAREVTGKIIFADESSKMLSLRVDMPQMQANKNMAKKGRKSPFRPAYQMVKVGKDFELPVEDKATVRRMFVAVEYDNKGFLKDSQKEKSILQAKGYIPAKYEDIKAGMIAKLYLTPPKAGAKDDAARPAVKQILLLQAANETTSKKK
jgi:hypothetical protein